MKLWETWVEDPAADLKTQKSKTQKVCQTQKTKPHKNSKLKNQQETQAMGPDATKRKSELSQFWKYNFDLQEI